MGVQRVRFTQSARKRRIGKAHVLAAMADAGEPQRMPATGDLDERLVWVGRDDRGVELEIIGIELPDYLLIIHVMFYSYRR
jgi:hypothetical protein